MRFQQRLRATLHILSSFSAGPAQWRHRLNILFWVWFRQTKTWVQLAIDWRDGLLAGALQNKPWDAALFDPLVMLSVMASAAIAYTLQLFFGASLFVSFAIALICPAVLYHPTFQKPCTPPVEIIHPHSCGPKLTTAAAIGDTAPADATEQLFSNATSSANTTTSFNMPSDLTWQVCSYFDAKTLTHARGISGHWLR